MSYDPTQYPHGDLTKQIIGAAMAVHRAIGPGLDEKIYENSMCLEFQAQAIAFTQQQRFPVYYSDHNVGNLITDLIAENKVIVEAKVATVISDTHIAQTLSYLAISGLKIGIILNFKNASLEFRRVANIYIKNP